MTEPKVCQNCEREVFNCREPYSWSYRHNPLWIHVHNQHTECDRPNVAVPLKGAGE